MKQQRALNVRRAWILRLAMLSSGGVALQLGGCDSQLRLAVENGVIDLVTNLFGAVTTALIELVAENATAGAA
ncbi:MAG: hypothetical protein SF069_18600 [Phycisphaerae bacterium]|nr:hypothetical protein [Phycisphaerae bacterium]